MRIGIMTGDSGRNNTIDALVARGQEIERRGFASMWMANIFALDAILTLAIVGRETKRIELGTAVVPTYPRHPFAMAQEAMTANMAAGGRFALGIGLSHKLVIEDMFGLSYDKPARHMREYLEVLAPMMRGEAVQYAGEVYRVATTLSIATPPPALLVAAMGDVMLKLTGELADGTVLWMTGAEDGRDPRRTEADRRRARGGAARTADRGRHSDRADERPGGRPRMDREESRHVRPPSVVPRDARSRGPRGTGGSRARR